MATRATVGGASVPPFALDAALAVILAQPPAVLSRFAARVIERLDELDGDPDVEPNGDEEDGTDAEDEALSRRAAYFGSIGPGCPVADPDYSPLDLGEEESGGAYL